MGRVAISPAAAWVGITPRPAPFYEDGAYSVTRALGDLELGGEFAESEWIPRYERFEHQNEAARQRRNQWGGSDG